MILSYSNGRSLPSSLFIILAIRVALMCMEGRVGTESNVDQ